MGIVFDTLRHLSLGRASRHGNLAVVPVMGPVFGGDSQRPPRYRPLATALRAGACRMALARNQTTQLRLANDSAEPVLVLSGETVASADQHRAFNLTLWLGPFAELSLPTCRVQRGRDAPAPSRVCVGLLPAAARAAQLADVSDSLNGQGLREANQAHVRAALAATSSEAGGESDTGLGELYASRHQGIAACTAACPIRPRQLGAIYCLNGRVEALEIFDSAATLRHFGRQVLASHAVAAGQGPTRVESVPDQRALAEFFVQSCEAEERGHEALGVGDDLRLEGEEVSGAGLVVAERLVHLLIYRRTPAPLFADPHIVPFRWRARATRLARV